MDLTAWLEPVSIQSMPRLANSALILTGVSPEPTLDQPVKFVQIKDLTLERRALTVGQRPTASRAVAIDRGDVLLAARGERTLAARPDAELAGAYIALDLYLIRPDPQRLDSDFLTAFLNRAETGAQLRASTAGASLPRIPKEALAELDVPLPDMARQQSIGRLARAIRSYRELSARLLEAQGRLYERRLEQAFAQLT